MNSVLLYVCADHRMTFPGASAEYVNRISAGELTAIRRRYPHVAEWLRPGMCMTKLRRSYTAPEMTADLELTRAPSDEEYRPTFSSGAPASELPLLAGVVAFFVTWKARNRRAASRRPGGSTIRPV
jgi:hypothetical protein